MLKGNNIVLRADRSEGDESIRFSYQSENYNADVQVSSNLSVTADLHHAQNKKKAKPQNLKQGGKTMKLSLKSKLIRWVGMSYVAVSLGLCGESCPQPYLL